MSRTTTTEPDVQRLLNSFVLGDCRLQEHPKVSALVRWRTGDALLLVAGTGRLSHVAHASLAVGGTSITSHCFVAKRAFLMDNSAATEKLGDAKEVLQDLFALESYLTLPILAEDIALGTLSLLTREPGKYLEKHVGRAQLLAALVAYTMLHVRGKTRRPSSVSMALGTAMRKVREEIGMTQLELALAMNRSAIALSRWESGAQPPSQGPLHDWCEALGLLCSRSPSPDYSRKW